MIKISGTILGSKVRSDGKIILDVLLDYDETVQLQGQIDNIHIFSENISHLKTNISTRGKNGATKYLLIPRDLRQNIMFDKPVNCQKIDLKDKIIFVYIIEKNPPSIE